MRLACLLSLLLSLSLSCTEAFSTAAFSFSLLGQKQLARDATLVLLSSSANGEGEEEADDDDELIRLIRGPLGAERPRVRPKAILILSDNTGVTAKSAVEKGLAQFNGCDERFFTIQQGNVDDDNNNNNNNDEACETMNTRIYPFIRTEEHVAKILKKAKGLEALLVFTLADTDLREKTIRMCELSNIQYVDLLGPMYDVMSEFFQRQPLGMVLPSHHHHPTNSRRKLSDSYYRRIEAVEFTLKCDDGMSPNQLKDADVILLGVSRTGKTPLSVVLAQSMGLKVSNIPLVVDLAPPRQLLAPEIDPQRVFCLTLNIDDLQRIRSNRLRREMRHAAKRGAGRSTYADPDYLYRDLENARQVAADNGYTVIDVTGRAVEETASLISSVLNERFPDSA